MSQSDGIHQLKRFEFEFAGNRYCFALNPEEYQQNEPSRTSIVQTRGGAFVDAWGAGLTEISFRGTTGFKNRTGDASNGFRKFVELRNLVRKVYADVKPGTEVKNLMKFYNYTDEEYWYVYPDKITLLRSKSKALLYSYDIRLIGLQRIGNCRNSHGKIGNPFKMSSTRSRTIDKSFGSGTRWLKEHRVHYVIHRAVRSNKPNIKSSNDLNHVIDDNITDNITTTIPPVQEGIKFNRNIDFSEKTIDDLKIIMDNLSELLGGCDGKVSPVVAKYLTTQLSVLKSGVISNINCTYLCNDGVKQIGFVNRWNTDTLRTYEALVDYDERVIEVNKYYDTIAVFLPQISARSSERGIQYRQLIPLLLNQGDKLNDSSIITMINHYNMNINYLSMIKSVVIQSIKIYNYLSSCIANKTRLRMTLSELDSLINNIKYITGVLEQYEEVPFDLLKEMRKLQVNISAIRGTPELFDNFIYEGV